jgi:CheY-like chemotaxis protein
MKTVNRHYGTLLVVDDIAANRDLLSRYFGARGFEIAEADSGLTALSMIKEQHFDAVLLDIIMPEIDGIEVLKRIRKSHTQADLPVFMVSGQSAHHDIRLSLDLGANDYFTKPIDLAVALTKLQHAFGVLPDKQTNPQVPETAGADRVRNPSELRRKARRQLQCTAWILLDKQIPPTKCTIADLSSLGTCVVLQSEQDLPNDFILLLTENGRAWFNCRLVWRTGLNVGIEFTSGLIESGEERPQIGASIDSLR